MRLRSIVILALAALALLLVTWVSRRAERSGEQLASGPIFPKLTHASIAGVRILDSADTVMLRLDGATWRVATESDFPADTLAVSRLLQQVGIFDRKYLRSNTPELQRTFEVDDAQGSEVTFTDAGGSELARLRLGKNGPDFRSQYVRPAGSNEVFLVPEYLRPIFDLKRPTWRDRTIFAFDREKVARITFHPAEGGPVVLEKDADGKLALVSPESGPVKSQAVDATLRTICALRCDAFPEPAPSLAEAGLLPPAQRVEVQLDDGSRFGLDVGKETPDAARVYVKQDGSDTIYLLSKGRAAALVRKVEDLRETPAAAGA
jgi:hypothetical protein